MPTITGNSYDVGTNPLGPTVQARMHFRLGHAARDVTGGLHFRKERTVETTAAGAFTVDLPEYVTHPRPVPVHVGVSWLEPTGYGTSGYTATDWLPDPIYVPRNGGVLGDLIGKQIGNDLVYVGPDVIDPTEQTGFQLNTTSWDLYQWQE